MTTMQKDLDKIGQSMRTLHDLADQSGDAVLIAAAEDLHNKLTRGFVRHVRPDHADLDWDAIAGNAPNESGGKHEPPAEL